MSRSKLLRELMGRTGASLSDSEALALSDLYRATDHLRGSVLDVMTRAAADPRAPLMRWPAVEAALDDSLALWGRSAAGGLLDHIDRVTLTSDGAFRGAVDITGGRMIGPQLPDQVGLARQYADLVGRRATSNAAAQVKGVAFLGTTGGYDQKRATKELYRILGTPETGGVSGVVADLERAYVTEASRAVNAVHTGRIDDMAESDPDLEKVWVCGRAKVHRPGHSELCGKRVGAKGKFQLRGADGETYLVSGPHDPSLPIGETINCHCRVIPAVPGWPRNWIKSVTRAVARTVQLQPRW